MEATVSLSAYKIVEDLWNALLADGKSKEQAERAVYAQLKGKLSMNDITSSIQQIKSKTLLPLAVIPPIISAPKYPPDHPLYGCPEDNEGRVIDPFSLEEIPETMVISYVEGNRKFCFDVRFLYQYITTGGTTNPSTRQPIPNDVLREVRERFSRKLTLLANGKEIIIEPFAVIGDLVLDVIRSIPGSILTNIDIYNVLDDRRSLYLLDLEALINYPPRTTFRVSAFRNAIEKAELLMNMFNFIKRRRGISTYDTLYSHLGSLLSIVPTIVGTNVNVPSDARVIDVIKMTYDSIGGINKVKEIAVALENGTLLAGLKLNELATSEIPGQDVYNFPYTSNESKDLAIYKFIDYAFVYSDRELLDAITVRGAILSTSLNPGEVTSVLENGAYTLNELELFLDDILARGKYLLVVEDLRDVEWKLIPCDRMKHIAITLKTIQIRTMYPMIVGLVRRILGGVQCEGVVSMNHWAIKRIDRRILNTEARLRMYTEEAASTIPMAPDVIEVLVKLQQGGDISREEAALLGPYTLEFVAALDNPNVMIQMVDRNKYSTVIIESVETYDGHFIYDYAIHNLSLDVVLSPVISLNRVSDMKDLLRNLSPSEFNTWFLQIFKNVTLKDDMSKMLLEDVRVDRSMLNSIGSRSKLGEHSLLLIVSDSKFTSHERMLIEMLVSNSPYGRLIKELVRHIDVVRLQNLVDTLPTPAAARLLRACLKQGLDVTTNRVDILEVFVENREPKEYIRKIIGNIDTRQVQRLIDNLSYKKALYLLDVALKTELPVTTRRMDVLERAVTRIEYRDTVKKLLDTLDVPVILQLIEIAHSQIADDMREYLTNSFMEAVATENLGRIRDLYLAVKYMLEIDIYNNPPLLRSAVRSIPVLLTLVELGEELRPNVLYAAMAEDNPDVVDWLLDNFPELDPQDLLRKAMSNIGVLRVLYERGIKDLPSTSKLLKNALEEGRREETLTYIRDIASSYNLYLTRGSILDSLIESGDLQLMATYVNLLKKEDKNRIIMEILDRLPERDIAPFIRLLEDVNITNFIITPEILTKVKRLIRIMPYRINWLVLLNDIFVERTEIEEIAMDKLVDESIRRGLTIARDKFSYFDVYARYLAALLGKSLERKMNVSGLLGIILSTLVLMGGVLTPIINNGANLKTILSYLSQDEFEKFTELILEERDISENSIRIILSDPRFRNHEFLLEKLVYRGYLPFSLIKELVRYVRREYLQYLIDTLPVVKATALLSAAISSGLNVSTGRPDISQYALREGIRIRK